MPKMSVGFIKVLRLLPWRKNFNAEQTEPVNDRYSSQSPHRKMQIRCFRTGLCELLSAGMTSYRTGLIKVSNSSRVGSEGCAPIRVALRAAT